MNEQKLTKAQLDAEILRALDEHGNAATYVIRNIVDWPGKIFHGAMLGTSHVLTACRRLERRGHVAEKPTSYLVMKVWDITPAGRAALSQADSVLEQGAQQSAAE
jgi:hypothetical protein